MPISVKATDIAIAGLTDIALPIQVTADGGVVETVTLKGLPATAAVSEAEKGAQDEWVIPFAKLGAAKVSFKENPSEVVHVEVVAAGSASGQPQTAKADFSITPSAQGAPPPLWQKVLILGIVLLITVPVFICWRLLYSRAQDFMIYDNHVSWSKPDGVSLNANPTTTFWYDPAGKLHHRGPIDAKEKQQILSLIRAAKPGTKEKTGAAQKTTRARDTAAADNDERFDSYYAAIDELTYASNKDYSRYFLYLLTIAGLSGVLGTQVRSLSNFVFIATRRERALDLRVWWPYYVARPATGFLLGLLAVLLVEAKLYVPDTQALPSGTVWWMGIAMLIGFASEEFGQRLRLVAQALFGKEEKKGE